MRQYVAYAKLITSTNRRRRSDGTLLDGRHSVSGRRTGSSSALYHEVCYIELV